MVDEATLELASLRFEGSRFQGHALDVECTQELIAYRTLVLECAKELWRRKNPARERLPRGFEEGFRLQFDRIEDGSARVPLRRVRGAAQGELDLGDEFEEAAALIDAAIVAADRDDLLPEQLPSNVIPLFANFGRTLREDEVLFTSARGSSREAPYTQKARVSLAAWVGPTYEDRVDVIGEVRMANLGPGVFKLQIVESGVSIEGHFDASQEMVVLDALKNHRSVRLHVIGNAEFSTRDRQVKRFIRIEQVGLAPSSAGDFDDSAPPIWDQLARIGEEAPAGIWSSVPNDLSERIDEVVYGRGDADR
ncbi:MAG TPA: hypothetical protein VHA82_24410 [Ramlibacter sp.]|uniref:hypothetical protein n=1 Tax=Ramlibacter sp. TaxID=1917967 RepID=UPI002CD5A313|nr:hypothetical protein [Ramlibacter sp.]HVZ46973.1 hypothetical protein [Ramlibacter sp.]